MLYKACARLGSGGFASSQAPGLLYWLPAYGWAKMRPFYLPIVGSQTSQHFLSELNDVAFCMHILKTLSQTFFCQIMAYSVKNDLKFV